MRLEVEYAFQNLPRYKNYDPEQALEKALHLLWLKGYDATSINDLVAELGISKASLYLTFGSKLNLFKKCFSLYMEKQIKEVGITPREKETTKALFTRFFKGYLDFLYHPKNGKGCLVVNTVCGAMPSTDFLDLLKDINLKVKDHFYTLLTTTDPTTNPTLKKGKTTYLANLFSHLYTSIALANRLGIERKENEELVKETIKHFL